MASTRFYPCVEINAPELFADPAFIVWLAKWSGYGLATWHHRGCQVPHEMSDVFFTYDHGEGSDAAGINGGMPQFAWDLICAEVKKLDVDYCVVRLTNF